MRVLIACLCWHDSLNGNPRTWLQPRSIREEGTHGGAVEGVRGETSIRRRLGDLGRLAWQSQGGSRLRFPRTRVPCQRKQQPHSPQFWSVSRLGCSWINSRLWESTWGPHPSPLYLRVWRWHERVGAQREEAGLSTCAKRLGFTIPLCKCWAGLFFRLRGALTGDDSGGPRICEIARDRHRGSPRGDPDQRSTTKADLCSTEGLGEPGALGESRRGWEKEDGSPLCRPSRPTCLK